jgi:hypothetical protein
MGDGACNAEKPFRIHPLQAAPAEYGLDNIIDRMKRYLSRKQVGL